MSVAPEHYRATRLVMPRLSLPAILGFAVAGLGGALFLAYTGLNNAEAKHSLVGANEVPVYSARAVPFDAQPEDVVQRATSIARALTATRIEPQYTEADEAARAREGSDATLVAEANGELKGFSRFSNFGRANSYLAITGANFGISGQVSPSGFVAPDAETASMPSVPEVSTWLCGVALLALIAARGVHAHWRRHQRRAANKTNSAGDS